jgi:hypothetical protein
VNPLTEPFLYEAVAAYQSDLRATSPVTAPEDVTRAVGVEIGRERSCATPCLWRLLTATR